MRSRPRRPPTLRLHRDELIVDNFAGGGGASVGIAWALGRDPDIAINHNAEAIAMHRANHPNTKHYTCDVFEVDPLKACGMKRKWRPGDRFRVGLAWFSPDCTFFSKARGQKPFRDKHPARKRRGLAGVMLKWADLVRPRAIGMENVEEFQQWGPLRYDRKRKGWVPDKRKKGISFRKLVARLRNLGYTVEWRELRACDFGAPTTRKRLFLFARCDGLPIVWPEPMYGDEQFLQPFRSAAECIDWSIPSASIFLTPDEAREWKKQTGKKIIRPLAPDTMRRIAAGVIRHVIESKQPFIVPLTHSDKSNRARGVDEPMATVTGANRGEHALVTPFLAKYHASKREGDDRCGDVREPLPTQDTANRYALVSPVLIQTSWGEREGQRPRYLNIHDPLGTIMADGIKHSVAEVKLERAERVAAFMVKHYGGEHENGTPKSGAGSDAREPLGTVTQRDHNYAVTAHLVNLKGSMDDRKSSSQEVTEPAPTVCANGNHIAEVRAFLVKYYGTDQDPRLEEPMHTITTKDRMALVTVEIAGETFVIVDICMRMLEPDELARATGFPEGYIINPFVDVQVRRGKKLVTVRKRLSKTSQVHMIGNAVSPPPATALLVANFAECSPEQLPLVGVAA